MNSVERVKAICKERKIAISRLEKDLGFANGYIGQLRKGTFPAERLSDIAAYLSVSTEYLMTGNEKEKPLINGDEELTEYVEMLKNRPECRMLFQLSKNATKEDVEAAVRIIEALRK